MKALTFWLTNLLLLLGVLALTPCVGQVTPGPARLQAGEVTLPQEPEPAHVPCISERENQAIQALVAERTRRWRANGTIPRDWFGSSSRELVGQLVWPLKQAKGFTDPSYYGSPAYR